MSDNALDRIRLRRAYMTRHFPDAVEARQPLEVKALPPLDGLDAEKFGEAIGLLIREMVEPLEMRIAELEGHPDRGQKAARRAGLAFRGAFQRALDYSEGDVVTHNDRVYVAVKDVPAGDGLREGMAGWVLMIKGAPQ